MKIIKYPFVRFKIISTTIHFTRTHVSIKETIAATINIRKDIVKRSIVHNSSHY